jgi:hypothetical protein
MGFHRGPKIITDGLVLALDAANTKSYPGNGSTWSDLSGNSNNGTLTNNPLFSDGSLIFNGSGKSSTLTSPFGQSNFTTASLWYKRVEANSSTTWRTLLGTANTNVHHLISQSSSRILGVWDGSFRSFGYTPPIDGKFHNFTIIYQSATNASLYVDGVFISTVVIVLNLTTSPIGLIGNWNGGNYWAGNISLPTIYNRALTPQEITQNFNALKNRFT